MITGALAVTMLGMGLTMDTSDILDAVQSPSQVALGVALQFTVMPLLAFALSRALPLPTPIAVGLILVGCCPGGTASNLVTYIASASVALSVVLTAASTLLASGVTPALCAALAGTLVPVPAAALMVSTAQVVLAPIALGILLKQLAPAAVAAAAPLCPPFAVATVALICASVIGGSAGAVRSAGPLLLLAVVTLHAGGFALGYAGAAFAGFPEKVRRTISIEVGMQNSALGCVLALAHFADPATAVPAAVSATVHSVLGSALAGVWRARDARAAAATGERSVHAL
jgi:BASS family bile acid:Na+ symporter